MKIFLCCGQDDNAPLAERVKNDLEARGHDVLTCLEQTRDQSAGEDARRIVAGLSRHSVNDPGVCLEALADALADADDQALTAILLEGEDKVRPPLLVSHAPQIDFSCWRAKQAEGPESFERWYAEAFAQLADTLESRGSPAGDIEELRRLLGISSAHSAWVKKAARCLQYDFAEQEWLESSVLSWLRDDVPEEETGVLHLTAMPDAVRGVLAARLAFRHNLHIAGLHFCEKTDSARDLLLSLAFQAGTRLPEYRTFLLASLRELPPGTLISAPADELFDLLLRRAAAVTVDQGQNRYAFVLDDLESGDAALADWVMQKAPDLPDWLRLVVTRNPDDPADCIRLADALGGAEKYIPAIALYQRAINVWQEAGDGDEPRLLPTCGKLADSLAASGDHAQALRLYGLILNILEEERAPDDPAIADVCVKAADILFHTMKALAEARSLYERALDIREKTLGRDHPATQAVRAACTA